MLPIKDGMAEFRRFCKNLDLRQKSIVIKKRQINLVKTLKAEAIKRMLKIVFLNSQNAKWAYQSLYE